MNTASEQVPLDLEAMPLELMLKALRTMALPALMRHGGQHQPTDACRPIAASVSASMAQREASASARTWSFQAPAGAGCARTRIWTCEAQPA
jgi:hypothetical protein